MTGKDLVIQELCQGSLMEFVIARCRSEAVRTVEFDFVVHGRTLAMAGPPGQLLTNLMA